MFQPPADWELGARDDGGLNPGGLGAGAQGRWEPPSGDIRRLPLQVRVGRVAGVLEADLLVRRVVGQLQRLLELCDERLELVLVLLDHLDLVHEAVLVRLEVLELLAEREDLKKLQ